MANSYPKPTNPRFEDLTGRRFGCVVVIEYHGKDRWHKSTWLIQCDCGEKRIVSRSSLATGRTKSCGCREYKRRREDLTGQRFGRLLVVAYRGRSERHHALYLCRCDCGTEKLIRGTGLTSRNTQSCGCLNREALRKNLRLPREIGRFCKRGHDISVVGRLRGGKGNCKACDKRDERKYATWKRQLKKNHDMTADEYDALLQRQAGRCAICGDLPEKRGKRLHVDHDHETGGIRGLLCGGCNLAIGYLQDSPMRAFLAGKYLKRHQRLRLVKMNVQNLN